MKKLKKWMMEQSQLVSCLIKPAVHRSSMPFSMIIPCHCRSDIRRSASTCAISSESPASKLVGAQEEVFNRPTISEELRVGG